MATHPPQALDSQGSEVRATRLDPQSGLSRERFGVDIVGGVERNSEFLIPNSSLTTRQSKARMLRGVR